MTAKKVVKKVAPKKSTRKMTAEQIKKASGFSSPKGAKAEVHTTGQSWSTEIFARMDVLKKLIKKNEDGLVFIMVRGDQKNTEGMLALGGMSPEGAAHAILEAFPQEVLDHVMKHMVSDKLFGDDDED